MMRVRASVGGLVVVAGLASCVPTSTGDTSMAQVVIEMGDAVNELRQENAMLQAQVDSLAIVVAKQDTVLRGLAAAAGIAMPR